ncbi:hypothetical protein I0C86_25785 [Plantactinospora sp. S1510]|uniref:Lipoprotein n=1 Tax=Plantactinospora alkalitolerans TaxID=2789879 RepID=A0ABS0H1I6_9ACTN|nr:hypothetical protein [Plantactinospora alkalitolerans]MBF9132332.1 hypothetical protein [Plantactinospora alkalitolerans]
MGLPSSRRRLVAMLGALVALLNGAACGRTAEPTAPPVDVGLTVSAQREAGALRIEYKLVNRAGEELVAFTGIPARDTHENPAVDPDAVYLTEGADGVVEIAKRVFPPPEGAGLAVDFVVRGSVVAPGNSVDEVVRVALPLRPRHPYDTEARLPEPARRAVFCVGVARRSEVPPLPTASGDSGDTGVGAVYPHRAGIARVQQMVCGEPFDL